MYYIIGVGGFAKEVLFLCKEVFGNLNDFAGFINKDSSICKTTCLGNEYDVISEKDFFENKYSSPDLYLGIGNPKMNENISKLFIDYNFPNLIYPNFIGHIGSIKFGKGNIVTSSCVFTTDITIGSYNIFNLSTTVGHDTIIGDYNVLNPSVNISGSVIIGNVNLFGTNCCVLQGLKIGDKSIIGAGAMVNKNVENEKVVVGIPARPIN